MSWNPKLQRTNFTLTKDHQKKLFNLRRACPFMSGLSVSIWDTLVTTALVLNWRLLNLSIFGAYLLYLNLLSLLTWRFVETFAWRTTACSQVSHTQKSPELPQLAVLCRNHHMETYFPMGSASGIVHLNFLTKVPLRKENSEHLFLNRK